jgi:hypothetical protein
MGDRFVDYAAESLSRTTTKHMYLPVALLPHHHVIPLTCLRSTSDKSSFGSGSLITNISLITDASLNASWMYMFRKEMIGMS